MVTVAAVLQLEEQTNLIHQRSTLPYK